MQIPVSVVRAMAETPHAWWARSTWYTDTGIIRPFVIARWNIPEHYINTNIHNLDYQYVIRFHPVTNGYNRK
jgi:hypothetical protein